MKDFKLSFKIVNEASATLNQVIKDIDAVKSASSELNRVKLGEVKQQFSHLHKQMLKVLGVYKSIRKSYIKLDNFKFAKLSGEIGKINTALKTIPEQVKEVNNAIATIGAGMAGSQLQLSLSSMIASLKGAIGEIERAIVRLERAFSAAMKAIGALGSATKKQGASAKQTADEYTKMSNALGLTVGQVKSGEAAFKGLQSTFRGLANGLKTTTTAHINMTAATTTGARKSHAALAKISKGIKGTAAASKGFVSTGNVMLDTLRGIGRGALQVNRVYSQTASSVQGFSAIASSTNSSLKGLASTLLSAAKGTSGLTEETKKGTGAANENKKAAQAMAGANQQVADSANKTQKAVGRLSRMSVAGFKEMLVGQAMWMIGFTLLLAPIALFTSALRDAVAVQDEFARTVRVLRPASGDMEDMAKVTAEAFSAMNDEMVRTGKGAQDVSEVLYQLGSAGLTAEEAVAALRSTMDVIVGTEADVTAITKTIAGIYNNLGNQMYEAADGSIQFVNALDAQAQGLKRNTDLSKGFAAINDVLVAAFRDHQIEMSELNDGLRYSIATASIAGVTYTELVGVLATLNDHMVKAGVAGRSFQSMLSRIVKSPVDFAKAFHIELPADQPLNVLNLFEQLHEQLNRGVWTVEQLGEAFKRTGLRGAKTFITLIQHFNDVQKNIQDLTHDVTGAAETMADIMLDRPAAALDRLYQALVQIIRISLDPIIKTFFGLIKVVNLAFRSVYDLYSSLPILVQRFVDLGIGTITLGALILGFGKLKKSIDIAKRVAALYRLSMIKLNTAIKSGTVLNTAYNFSLRAMRTAYHQVTKAAAGFATTMLLIARNIKATALIPVAYFHELAVAISAAGIQMGTMTGLFAFSNTAMIAFGATVATVTQLVLAFVAGTTIAVLAFAAMVFGLSRLDGAMRKSDRNIIKFNESFQKVGDASKELKTKIQDEAIEAQGRIVRSVGLDLDFYSRRVFNALEVNTDMGVALRGTIKQLKDNTKFLERLRNSENATNEARKKSLQTLNEGRYRIQQAELALKAYNERIKEVGAEGTTVWEALGFAIVESVRWAISGIKELIIWAKSLQNNFNRNFAAITDRITYAVKWWSKLFKDLIGFDVFQELEIGRKIKGEEDAIKHLEKIRNEAEAIIQSEPLLFGIRIPELQDLDKTIFGKKTEAFDLIFANISQSAYGITKEFGKQYAVNKAILEDSRKRAEADEQNLNNHDLIDGKMEEYLKLLKKANQSQKDHNDLLDKEMKLYKVINDQALSIAKGIEESQFIGLYEQLSNKGIESFAKLEKAREDFNQEWINETHKTTANTLASWDKLFREMATKGELTVGRAFEMWNTFQSEGGAAISAVIGKIEELNTAIIESERKVRGLKEELQEMAATKFEGLLKLRETFDIGTSALTKMGKEIEKNREKLDKLKLKAAGLKDKLGDFDVGRFSYDPKEYAKYQKKMDQLDKLQNRSNMTQRQYNKLLVRQQGLIRQVQALYGENIVLLEGTLKGYKDTTAQIEKNLVAEREIAAQAGDNFNVRAGALEKQKALLEKQLGFIQKAADKEVQIIDLAVAAGLKSEVEGRDEKAKLYWDYKKQLESVYNDLENTQRKLINNEVKRQQELRDQRLKQLDILNDLNEAMNRMTEAVVIFITLLAGDKAGPLLDGLLRRLDRSKEKVEATREAIREMLSEGASGAPTEDMFGVSDIAAKGDMLATNNITGAATAAEKLANELARANKESSAISDSMDKFAAANEKSSLGVSEQTEKMIKATKDAGAHWAGIFDEALGDFMPVISATGEYEGHIKTIVDAFQKHRKTLVEVNGHMEVMDESGKRYALTMDLWEKHLDRINTKLASSENIIGNNNKKSAKIIENFKLSQREIEGMISGISEFGKQWGAAADGFAIGGAGIPGFDAGFENDLELYKSKIAEIFAALQKGGEATKIIGDQIVLNTEKGKRFSMSVSLYSKLMGEVANKNRAAAEEKAREFEEQAKVNNLTAEAAKRLEANKNAVNAIKEETARLAEEYRRAKEESKEAFDLTPKLDPAAFEEVERIHREYIANPDLFKPKIKPEIDLSETFSSEKINFLTAGLSELQAEADTIEGFMSRIGLTASDSISQLQVNADTAAIAMKEFGLTASDSLARLQADADTAAMAIEDFGLTAYDSIDQLQANADTVAMAMKEFGLLDITIPIEDREVIAAEMELDKLKNKIASLDNSVIDIRVNYTRSGSPPEGMYYGGIASGVPIRVTAGEGYIPPEFTKKNLSMLRALNAGAAVPTGGAIPIGRFDGPRGIDKIKTILPTGSFVLSQRGMDALRQSINDSKSLPGYQAGGVVASDENDFTDIAPIEEMKEEVAVFNLTLDVGGQKKTYPLYGDRANINEIKNTLEREKMTRLN